LSFARLRLKLTFAIFVAHPTGKVKRRVQKAFLELGKIGTTSVKVTAQPTS